MSQPSTNQVNSNEVNKVKFNYNLWIFLISTLLLMGVSGGVGFVATSMILKLPRSESCPKIYWPLASASMRLYCAQLASTQGTVEGWVQAINMVKVLPEEHIIRPEVNENIEQWVQGILAEGEQMFQSGKIDEAMSIAAKVPEDVATNLLVEKTTSKWQSIWSEGENREKQIEKYLSTGNWSDAFREAIQLTNLENQYWSTVKYEETLNEIQVAKTESSKLESAYALLEKGQVDDILQAMTEAEKIDTSSSAYSQAQSLIEQAQNDLLKIIESKIQQRDWQELEITLGKITEKAELTGNVEDWYQLAKAGTTANQGTVKAIEEAIVEAEKIPASSPIYYEAQKLTRRWKLEIEDLKELNTARNIAQQGRIQDLEAAIATVESIPVFHPRYQEAQTEISRWTREIQVIEDRPILNKAQQLASAQTVQGWQAAIIEATKITPNRPLYPQAQNIIQQSRQKIQYSQDRPILDQAITLANQENWSGAIAKARELSPQRSLYAEAQQKIRTWQEQLQAQENLQEAYRLAETKTADALIQAINLASQIPNYAAVKPSSNQAINQWAEDLLVIAEETSNSSLDEAINIATAVPKGTTAYNSARTYMEIWRKRKSQSPLIWTESDE